MGADADRKKELKRDFKERLKPAGVFQIKNMANGKALVGVSLNLDGTINRHRFTLSTGSHPNRPLQKDWTEHGADAFVFEVLEAVTMKDDPGFDLNDELALLEEIWIERLQPFGDHGYNESPRARQS